ncbi:hypothetical protein D3C76_167450 [compost metagenome]
MLAWFIVSVFLIAFLIAFVYERWALAGIEYDRYFSKRSLFEEETLEMVEVISNAKLLPLPWLRLESSMSRWVRFGKASNLNVYSGDIYQNHISLFFLRPYRQITRRHKVTCMRRGVYHLRTATLTTGDPLGLISKARQFDLDSELMVYPRILPLQELPLPNHSWLGNLIVRRWIVEDPFLTAGVREYLPGDGMRSINWKATARTNALQVHQRDYTADHRLLICLNIESSENMWKTVTDPERIEVGIRYASSVAGYALQNGIETGLLCNGQLTGKPHEPIVIEPSAVSDQLKWLLETLAQIELVRTVSMFRLLEKLAEEGTTNTDVLIISCHRGDSLFRSAQLLQRKGNGIEWMDIPEVQSSLGECAI